MRARLTSYWLPLRDRLTAFAESPRGQRMRKIVRALFLAGLVFYLVYRFSEIGWGEILRSLPGDWRFYAIFLILYLTLPISESLIYRLSWGAPAVRSFPAFIKKRVYNKDLFGYSGEMYLIAWARRHVGLPVRRILGVVRDNVVVSGFASTVFSVLLLVLFLVVGDVTVLGITEREGALYVVGALGVAAVVAAVGTRWRHVLFTLPGKLLLVIFAIHVLRLAGMNVLQVVQWDLAVPGVAWQVWLVFLAAQVVLSRLPLLPARDLLFLGASVELAALLGIPRAEVAAMLVVLSALDKALNLALFLAVSAIDRRRPEIVRTEIDQTVVDEAAEVTPVAQ